MSEKIAKRKISDWIDKFKLQRIQCDTICESYEEVVRQANLKVVRTKGEDYRIGESDIKIISGFLKEKVNIVHARDKGLEETCKELGLNVVPTPKRDTDKENSLRRG
jgi:predicted transcriptional regulator